MEKQNQETNMKRNGKRNISRSSGLQNVGAEAGKSQNSWIKYNMVPEEEDEEEILRGTVKTPIEEACRKR